MTVLLVANEPSRKRNLLGKLRRRGHAVHTCMHQDAGSKLTAINPNVVLVFEYTETTGSRGSSTVQLLERRLGIESMVWVVGIGRGVQKTNKTLPDPPEWSDLIRMIEVF